MYLRNCRSFKSAKKIGSAYPKSANPEKYIVRRLQISYMPHLQKVRKFKEKFYSENLRFAKLIADRPPWTHENKAELMNML
jgi:hypothetical protein